MPLASGIRLGPYEILALIGAGGMGEVYRARDTRLNRDVALKVSKDQFSERFEREARAVAALNHPNICHLYDVGPNYLVMELVEGEDLACPVPISAALDYARQIAEAIEAAHEKGIVHRDLKPANIKIGANGTVKVLDFGLAKALEDDAVSAPGSDSPTLSMAMTRAGMILGTAAYMSPEQAKGKQADRRADIWAFGIVLYEMLVGKQVFSGETAAETLASVLKEPVDLGALPKETPPAVRRMLERCLDRNIRQRLQSIGEARIVLENPGAAEDKPAPAAPPAKLSWIPWAVSGVLLAILIASVAWYFSRPTPALPVTRFPFVLGEGQAFTQVNLGELAISRDGTQMVYVADRRLYLRPMSELDARPIPGTETNVSTPVFSPDGKSLAYVSRDDLSLKRIAVTGGAPVTICSVSNAPMGMSWGEGGIVFAVLGQGILRISPNGGQPTVLVQAKDDEMPEGPQMLPGGKEILFTLGSGAVVTSVNWDKARIVVQNLKSGARKVVVDGGADARYLPTGHLVYALSGVLFAIPFDAGRLESPGGPVSIVEGLSRGVTGVAQLDFSDNGSLVYIPGPVSAGTGQRVLGLVDRKGEAEPLKMPAVEARFPRVSKDGKQVAYELDEGKESGIWIYDLAGASAPRRLTLAGTGSNRDPIWSSDGLYVAFQSDREGDGAIWRQRADGSGAAERLTKPDKGVAHVPDSWSPDGQYFSYSEEKGKEASVWAYSMRDKKTTLVAQMPGAALNRSVFSPDGHWIAYQLGIDTQSKIYVRPFPVNATVYVAPVDGDTHHPMWAPDGKEIFYIGGAGIVGSMSFTTKPAVTFGTPARWPRSGFTTGAPGSVRTYDVLPNGRLIGAVTAGQGPAAGAPKIEVVLNWFEEVKQRAPGK